MFSVIYYRTLPVAYDTRYFSYPYPTVDTVCSDPVHMYAIMDDDLMEIDELRLARGAL